MRRAWGRHGLGWPLHFLGGSTAGGNGEVRTDKGNGVDNRGGHEDTVCAEGVLVWSAGLQSDQLGSNSTPSYHLHVVVETLSLSFCIFEMGMLVLASVRSRAFKVPSTHAAHAGGSPRSQDGLIHGKRPQLGSLGACQLLPGGVPPAPGA